MPKKITQDFTKTATELANLGKLEEALKICQTGFKIEPTNKFIYFTYALALAELNQINEAERAFRKSIFLDNKFVLAHFQLGLLLLRKNQKMAGIKSLENAFNIASSENPSETVPGSLGLSYQRFFDILKNEMSLYAGGGDLNGNKK